MAKTRFVDGTTDGSGSGAKADGIDPRVPRFSQAITGVLLLAAFLLAGVLPAVVWAVPALAVALGAGALFGPRFNLWGLAFRHLVKPVFKLGPPASRKDGAPPRFAMLLGTLFLAAATVLLLVGSATATVIGWVFALAVAALALLAAVTNLCVGCEIYNLALRMRSKPATDEEEPPQAARR